MMERGTDTSRLRELQFQQVEMVFPSAEQWDDLPSFLASLAQEEAGGAV